MSNFSGNIPQLPKPSAPLKKSKRKLNGNALLSAALNYAARGWHVFPLASLAKVPPKASRGHLDACDDANIIKQWWTAMPNANLGLATGRPSGVFVVDVDPRNGSEKTLLELEQQGFELNDETLVTQTCQGGQHFFYRMPDFDLRCSQGNRGGLGAGLDVKSTGGYAVLPPSYVVDPAEDIDGGYTILRDLPPAPAPQWILDTLLEPKKIRLYTVPGTIEEGRRDDTLTSLGGALRAQGKDHDAILAALHAANEKRCQPPLDSKDVGRIAASICRYEQGDSNQDIIDQLAGLSPGEYEAQRKTMAKQLGWRTGVLDRLVEQARQQQENIEPGGSGILFEEATPWPEPVATAALLNEITELLQRHVLLADEQDHVIALWILGTYVFDVFDIYPLLAALSPEPRCGKTTLLTLLSRLCHKALPASNISPSALFRTVEKYRPCLIIDEADSFLKASDELRGILNSGHGREYAFVVRCVGDDAEPRRFSTWGPKALGLIGQLPTTLHDRSVVIQMRRKNSDEKIVTLTRDPECMEPFNILRRKLQRWAQDSMETLKNHQPKMPDELFNRSADNFRPLLSIADHAGNDWPALARESALKITATTSDEKSLKTQLLEDIREIFEENLYKFLATKDLVDKLNYMDDRPWNNWYGKSFTAHTLAKMLKSFSIKPTQVRSGNIRIRGYELKSFEDAFDRYLV